MSDNQNCIERCCKTLHSHYSVQNNYTIVGEGKNRAGMNTKTGVIEIITDPTD